MVECAPNADESHVQWAKNPSGHGLEFFYALPNGIKALTVTLAPQSLPQSP
ncbi:hypothetical protein XBFFL1_1040003 [Xenorhabdus bovienii str. feltiae Florida]|nr:hypothetical protein XBFFL1_1040003 [Xenorhabdus bovienii str. feltiae Florida]